MILYFSGTGNSKYVAKVIGEKLNDEIVSMNKLIKNGFEGTLNSEKPYVFVFPSYASYPPKIVLQLMHTIQLSGCQEAYFVMTAGDNIGGFSAKILKKICNEKQLQFRGLAGISMPKNHVTMYNVADKETGSREVQKAIPAIIDVAQQIERSEQLVPDKKMITGAVMRRIVGPVYLALVCGTKGFHVNDSCTGCGKCVRNCPVNAIRLENKIPIWNGKNCAHCMSCISGCPTRAINYKNVTQNRDRYYLSYNQ